MKMALARQAAQALERARLYEALSEAERRMSFLAEASRVLAYVGDGVFLVDSDSIVRYWNRAARLIAGVEENDAIGKPAVEVVPGWALIEEHVQPAEATSAELGRAAAIPVSIDDEERWLSVVGVELGDGRVYAMRDVTEEHALEQARSEFVATASHELRTPLAAVYGAVKTLRREDLELEGSVANTFLEMIESETERLSAIVNQILLAGQLESGRVSLVEREFDLRRARRRRARRGARHRSRDGRVPGRGRQRSRTAPRRRGQAAPGAGQPDRERGQVLAGRRHGHGRPQRRERPRADRGARPGARDPGSPTTNASSRSSRGSIRGSRAASAARGSVCTSRASSWSGWAVRSSSPRLWDRARPSRSSCRLPRPR